MEDRVDIEHEDFHYYGNPIEQEEETWGNQYRKKVKDAASTRALPVWKQEVTDEQGRRRFHGAFTGGFSAGYYNTVGSKEGWAPSTFKSSRDQRTSVQQSVEQFLDEDELADLHKTNLQTTSTYDTFGSTAAEVARRAAEEEGRQRPHPIPGLLPDEVLAPVADSIGVKLLQRMGWRQGKGVGTAEMEEGGSEDEPELDPKQRRMQRKWSRHTTIAAQDTPLYLLAPKNDTHGLGFDPFQGAKEFREAKQRRLDADNPHLLSTTTLGTAPTSGRGGFGGNERGGGGGALGRKRGIAFGAGVLDEDDDSYGILEDYVTHNDEEVEGYVEGEGLVDERGVPVGRGPRVNKRGLGDRLALTGYTYEIMDEEEEEDVRPHKKRKEQLMLTTGQLAPLLIQSKDQITKGGLIPGFVKAGSVHEYKYFPPPTIPKNYVPRCPLASTPAATPGHHVDLGPEPPQVDPPTDPVLRQEIDRLAFYVARNGVIFENLARQRQRTEGSRTFLLPGGLGAPYYQWKLYSLRKLIGAQGKKVERSIGQRSMPLTVDDRGRILGETPLEAAPSTAPAAAAAGQSAGPQGDPKLARSLLNVAEADRLRLQQILGSSFVKASATEVLQPDEALMQAGLRPGAPKPPPPGSVVGPQQQGTIDRAAGAPAPRVITAADLSRPVQLAVESGLPVRRIEEWRPSTLLCKRLNVPDPYKGKAAEVQLSKFKTDYLALPDTAAAVAAAAARAAPGAEEFLLPPSVKSAVELAKEASENKALLETQQLNRAAAAAVSERVPMPRPGEEEDAAGMADAFLNSLLCGDGGAGGETEPVWGAAGATPADAAPPLPAGKPIDLFKAILEGSDSEDNFDSSDDDEEEKPTNNNTNKQPMDQGAIQPTVDLAAMPEAGVKQVEYQTPGVPAPRSDVYAGREDDQGEKKERGGVVGFAKLMKERVEKALKVLKKSKKSAKKKKSKDKKRSKDKKHKKEKRQHKQSKHRRHSKGEGPSQSSSGSDSEDSSGSSDGG